MKMPCRAAILCGLLLAGPAFGAGESGPVEPGWSEAQVEASAGTPMGKLRQGGRLVWMYPRGAVEFEKGRVVKADLMTDDEYAADQARRRQWAEARRAAEADGMTNRPAASPRPDIRSGEPNRGTLDETRFYRPFVRPTYEGVDHYNGIPVVFEIEQWPPAMRKGYDLSVQIPTETGQRRTTFQTLLYELKKYPDEMLEHTLRCIYMIRDIRGSGGEGSDPAGVAFYTEGIVLEHTYMLHHEYAHQLHYLFHDAFPAGALGAVSGPYKGYGHGERLFYKDLWKEGYTSNYAMCSVHEDFAEFCEMLYLQPDVLFMEMKDHAKLAEKFAVIRPFLEMAKRRTTGDAAPMDGAYFKRFDRSRWKP